MSGSMFDMLRKRNKRFKRSRMVFFVQLSDVSRSFGEFVRATLEKELQEKMLRELKKEIELKAKAMLSSKSSGQYINRARLIGKIKRIFELKKLVSYPATFVRSRYYCHYRHPISTRALLNGRFDIPLDMFVSVKEDNCTQKKLIVNHAFDMLDVNRRKSGFIQYVLTNQKMFLQVPLFPRTEHNCILHDVPKGGSLIIAVAE